METAYAFRLFSLLLLSLLLHLSLVPAARAADPPALPLTASEYSVVILGEPSSSARVDFFLDLVCVDTKNAWPVIKEVIEMYGRDVQWRFHQFPLPYHTNAFLVAKGAVIAALYANDTAALDYMDVAFDRQSDVLNEETKDMSYAEVSERVQGWVRETTGLSDKRVKQGLELGEVEEAVRVSFKYAAIRSVFGTPMFMINQIMVPGLDSESGLQDWKMYLEPLLARAERKD
ncbi:hypothetical protein VYU27_007992 [Nannochloropsis oceanica]